VGETLSGRTEFSVWRAGYRLKSRRIAGPAGGDDTISTDHMKRIVVLAGVLIIEIAMSIALMPWTNHDRIKTTDFVNFYAAATIVRAGNSPTLYTAETQDPVLRSILGRKSLDYFLHPPFFAAALVPLSYLKVERAFVVWTLFNLALVGSLPMILAESVSFVARRPYLGLVGMVFFPVLTTLTLGQDSIVLLFVISIGYVLLTRRRDAAAGLVFALAAIKFQYVLVIVGFLLVARKFRVAASFAVGGAILILASLLVTGFAGFAHYVQFVREYDLHDGYGAMHLAQMVNWRGFFAGLGWMTHIRTYSTVGSVLLLILGIVCARSARAAESQDLAFSLYVAIALAASPYAYFQDTTILLLPIFLAMDSAVSGRIGRTRGKVLAVCCLLVFLWPIILLMMGGHYWWNSRIYLMFPVILLFVGVLVAELHLRNAARAVSMVPTPV
jgi:hypothetical protein